MLLRSQGEMRRIQVNIYLFFDEEDTILLVVHADSRKLVDPLHTLAKAVNLGTAPLDDDDKIATWDSGVHLSCVRLLQMMTSE
jgi:hypothetical protein